MTKVIALYEFLFTVRRKSFLFVTLGMPLIMMVYGGIISLIAQVSFSGLEDELKKPVGVVDEAGLLTALRAPLQGLALNTPYEFKPRNLAILQRLKERGDDIDLELYTKVILLFRDLASAKSAFHLGDVRSIVVIEKDYLQSADVSHYIRQNPLLNVGGIYPVNQLLEESLLRKLDVPQAELSRLLEGAFVTEYKMDQAGAASQLSQFEHELSLGVPLGISILLIVVLMLNAGLLVSSVVQEKENKVIEIILSSVTPQDLLFGKVLGLVAAGLLQMIVWLLMVSLVPVLALSFFGQTVNIDIKTSHMIWAAVFGVLGLIFYGIIFAGIGSLGSTERDTRYLSSLALIISGFPMFLAFSFSVAPNGVLARVLSLIPFFSPSAMILRVVLGTVPLWEIVTALLIILVSIWLALRVSAKIFRTGMLLYGKQFRLREVIAALSSG